MFEISSWKTVAVAFLCLDTYMRGFLAFLSAILELSSHQVLVHRSGGFLCGSCEVMIICSYLNLLPHRL